MRGALDAVTAVTSNMYRNGSIRTRDAPSVIICANTTDMRGSVGRMKNNQKVFSRIKSNLKFLIFVLLFASGSRLTFTK